MSVEEGTGIDEIMAGHSAHVVYLVGALRALITQNFPDLTEEPKRGWNNITYRSKGLVCAISPHKEHVNLNFYKGVSLPDPHGLLQGSGKALRHVKVIKPEDIRADEITQLIQAAVDLDEG